jgi:hypothetical protein
MVVDHQNQEALELIRLTNNGTQDDGTSFTEEITAVGNELQLESLESGQREVPFSHSYNWYVETIYNVFVCHFL